MVLIMLKFARYTLIALYIAVVFSIGIILALIRPRHPNTLYYTTKLLAWKGFDILGIDFELRGFKIHQKLGPAVYCSNHQNNLDMFPGGATTQKRTVVLGKTSVLFIPFFGQFFWLSGNFLINRGNPDKAKKSMEKITRKIREENYSVWIMPEGTRSRGRGLLPFKKGAFITAIAANCPIAPIVFSSYTRTLDLNKWKSGRVIARCLPPISTEGMTKEDVPRLMELTYQTMKNCLEELDEEILKA